MRSPPAPRATSGGCWRPGCRPSSATASSRRRWPARCCSTRSGRPTRSPSPPVSPSCCCRTRWSAPSPGSGWTAGAAARCCCVANVLRAVLVAVVAALVLAGVAGHGRSTLAGLAVFSVNRFVLAALSAGAAAHHRRRRPWSRRTRCRRRPGRWPTVVGGGAAIGLLQLTGSGDAGYAALALAAGAAVPGRLGRGRRVLGARDLGPDHVARARPRLTRRATSLHGHAGRRPARLRAPAGGRRAGRDQPAPALLRRPDADDAAAVPQHVRRRRRAVPRRAGRAGRGRWPPARSARCWPPS